MFSLSPSVNIQEIDLTTVVPSVATTDAAVAGPFAWGPIEDRILVGSENDLVKRFNKPNSTNYKTWFSAANFLAYSNRLWVVRVASTANTKNATTEATTGSGTAGTGFLIKNRDHYELNYDDGSLNVGQYVAKYAGTMGNSLKISTCPSANAYQSTISGTVSVTANTSTVTGVGTSFTTQVSVGDLLTINGVEVQVATVANTTSLTLSTAHSTGASANTCVRRWEYFYKVDNAPGTTDYASSVGGSHDEIHVVVVDEDGKFTGVPDTVLEVYQHLSVASDAKTENGSTNYYKNVINQQSEYVWWADHLSGKTNAGSTAVGTTFGAPYLASTFSFAGGHDGDAIVAADKIRGYDMFASAEDVDVSLIIGADADATVATHIISNICETRMDCVGVFSPLEDDVVNNAGNEADDIVTFRNLLPSTSYAMLDSCWKYQYDKYNDVYRYVPMNGDVAGTMARTDATRDPWWSPAGYNRGNIKNIIKVSYNPSKTDRDILYKNGINPVTTFPGQGTVLFGDKTLLSKPSAFDRINVRRLFIVLEKAIATASKYMLFEFNDEFTRAQFVNMVEPFLRDVQGRRGIYDFKVVCDDSNNTGEVIDRDEFAGDIYIKPSRSINFINLRFVAVRTGVAFEEIVGKTG